MTAGLRLAASALAAAFVLHAAGAARAQSRPFAQRVLSRGAIFARPRSPRPIFAVGTRHDVFGTIVALRGERLTLRRRTGPALVVDASAAIAAGTYSAPLFPGKIVEVTGTYTGTVLRADTIARLTHLDPGTRGDR